MSYSNCMRFIFIFIFAFSPLVGSNIPQSLAGMIEVSFEKNSNAAFIFYYDADDNSYGYIDLAGIDNSGDAVLEQSSMSISWNGITGNMEFPGVNDVWQYDFFNSSSPYFFPFKYSCQGDYVNNGYGFFYDGSIDLDKNGIADGEQLTSGIAYSFDPNEFNEDLLLNILFAFSPGEFFASYLPLDSNSENNSPHYIIKTLQSFDLENWETIATRTVKGTATNLFFKSEIIPSE